MKLTYRFIIVLAVCGLVAPLARGQAVLDKTTLGQSQNDARDLQNSLIVPKRSSIKGEKTEQVDPQKLPSRSVKDAKFQGSLLEMGLGSTDDPDLHQEKARSATEKDSRVSKQADPSGDKEKPSKSADPAGHGQNKDQKATSAAADEKSSGNATVKASATKPDGDH